MIAKIVDLRAAHATFADLPSGRWAGCKGKKLFVKLFSRKKKIPSVKITNDFTKKNINLIFYIGSGPTYGGYPCSLWTLWHVLTVNQDREENPPSKVITN